MGKLTFGMNVSLDGYIATPGGDLGWSVPSHERFSWWSDRVGATGTALYGRRLWQTMSSHWPTADQQSGATPAEMEFARRWRDMSKVVFSSELFRVDLPWLGGLPQHSGLLPVGGYRPGCRRTGGVWWRTVGAVRDAVPVRMKRTRLSAQHAAACPLTEDRFSRRRRRRE
ncbi:dihydrofolate reductase family protein [Blastococcus atacamensis]|uniref:dihydrofolate reductase family protein n=1 Tax=Blastococcus atacamensis TaxID=2070508 RepID=UPI001E56EEBF|nr:dihydrofolate reductase family protein [Blastococcus atacamensis]